MLWLSKGCLSCCCPRAYFPAVLKEGWRTGATWFLFAPSAVPLLLLLSPARILFSLTLGWLDVEAGESQIHPVHPAVPRTCSSEVLRWALLGGSARLLSSGDPDTLNSSLSTAASVLEEPQASFIYKTHSLELTMMYHSPDLSFCHQPSESLVSLGTKIPGNIAYLLDHRLIRTSVIVEKVGMLQIQDLIINFLGFLGSP